MLYSYVLAAEMPTRITHWKDRYIVTQRPKDEHIIKQLREYSLKTGLISQFGYCYVIQHRDTVSMLGECLYVLFLEENIVSPGNHFFQAK